VQDLTVTLVQAPLAWQDAAANRAYFERVLGALTDPTKLIVLPEMFATGFTMTPETCAESMEGESVAWMRATASSLDATLCGSLVIAANGRYFNRLVWASPDGTIGWYDKRHLFRMADEHRHYTAGNERQIFHIGEWRICPLVCYDLRFPVWCRGANVFDMQLFVANWPAARRTAWRTLLPARGVENQCYVAGVNRIGVDGNGVRYAGDSLAADPLGNLLVDLGDREDAVTLRLDGGALLRYREKFPAWRDADRFELLGPDDPETRSRD
jgi:predicted amidohydrolase